MRKGLFVLLSLALVVALAVPAAAEFKLSGMYRVKPTLSNYLTASTPKEFNTPGTETAGSGSLTKDFISGGSRDTANSAHFTEMRNRLRFEVGDENVKGVTHFEIDGNFGDTGGKIGRNEGFASNGDSVNIETKQVYVWFKIPDTNLSFTVGLQGYTDEFGGFIFNAADQPGVVANLKVDPVALRLSWIKLRGDFTFSGADPVQQGAGLDTSRTDADADYYAVDAKLAPTPQLGATLHFAFIRDSKGATTGISEVAAGDVLKLYYLGARGDFKLDPVTLALSFVYNFGTYEQTGGLQDVDISGFAVRVRADAKLGPGNAFLEGLYISGDDDRTAATTTTDAKYKSFITGSNYAPLTAFYTSSDVYILFPSIDDTNSAAGLTLNPNNNGRGVLHASAGYSQKFTEKVTGKVGVGYLAAVKERPTSVANKPEGKDMGTEINAFVNYNISKGLDFGVIGAYAMLGSFYDRGKAGSASAGQESPDDLYKFIGRLNYAF